MAYRRVPYDFSQKSYELHEEIGRGSFGVVRRCVDLISGFEYAAKLIDVSRISRSEFGHLEREAEICRSLRHPNIVQLHETFYSGKHFVLIFDLVTGGELFEDIVRRSFYSESCASDCIYRILSAVSYFHDQGVIHRDLKPENLLLTNRSLNPEIKVADFGLAIRVPDDYPHRNGIAGTYTYMAPEMIKGLAYTKAVDMWSMGVILYLLLSGHPPFWDNRDSVLQAKIVRGQYHYDAQIWKSISHAAKDLIDRMLTRNPYDRITAKQALMHPWLQQKIHPSTKLHLSETISQLRKFNARRKFKAAILTTIAINRLNQHAVPQAKLPIGFVVPGDLSCGNSVSRSMRPTRSDSELTSSTSYGNHSEKKITILRGSDVMESSQFSSSKDDSAEGGVRLLDVSDKVNARSDTRQLSMYDSDYYVLTDSGVRILNVSTPSYTQKENTNQRYFTIGSNHRYDLNLPPDNLTTTYLSYHVPAGRTLVHRSPKCYYNVSPSSIVFTQSNIDKRPMRQRSRLYYLID